MRFLYLALFLGLTALAVAGTQDSRKEQREVQGKEELRATSTAVYVSDRVLRATETAVALAGPTKTPIIPSLSRTPTLQPGRTATVTFTATPTPRTSPTITPARTP